MSGSTPTSGKPMPQDTPGTSAQRRGDYSWNHHADSMATTPKHTASANTMKIRSPRSPSRHMRRASVPRVNSSGRCENTIRIIDLFCWQHGQGWSTLLNGNLQLVPPSLAVMDLATRVVRDKQMSISSSGAGHHQHPAQEPPTPTPRR